MAHLDPPMGHLLRRAGFGASAADAPFWNAMSLSAATDRLVDYESAPGDVDEKIGTPGYLGTTSRGPFEPNTQLEDAAQRWMFRLVHSERPLQEKMALFWHNHFATGIFKVADQLSFEGAVRAMAAKPSEDVDGVKGQLELFREHALGNFRDLLLAVSQDPAMVAWLDGDTNLKEKPQENYARELMELFTIGVDHYTEDDVYAGARVFTGWNLEPHARGEGEDEEYYFTFRYNQRQHDSGEKTFSFAIYPDGNRTIPARAASAGFQDGIDLVNAVAAHPETGAFLARKLYAFFVNEKTAPDETLIQQLAATYYASGFEMREVVRQLLRSPHFHDPANYWARYSWPVEFVTRYLKEVGWVGFSAQSAFDAMITMGQTLFSPPNVAGWSQGSAWFSTSTMLSRMNFASWLAWVQRYELEPAAAAAATTPDTFLAHYLDRLSAMPFDKSGLDALRGFLTEGGPWTGSTHQIVDKGAGLAHLIGASGEYQFI